MALRRPFSAATEDNDNDGDQTTDLLQRSPTLRISSAPAFNSPLANSSPSIGSPMTMATAGSPSARQSTLPVVVDPHRSRSSSSKSHDLFFTSNGDGCWACTLCNFKSMSERLWNRFQHIKSKHPEQFSAFKSAQLESEAIATESLNAQMKNRRGPTIVECAS